MYIFYKVSSNKILIKISMFIIQITTLTMIDNKKTY